MAIAKTHIRIVLKIKTVYGICLVALFE